MSMNSAFDSDREIRFEPETECVLPLDDIFAMPLQWCCFSSETLSDAPSLHAPCFSCAAPAPDSVLPPEISVSFPVLESDSEAICSSGWSPERGEVLDWSCSNALLDSSSSASMCAGPQSSAHSPPQEALSEMQCNTKTSEELPDDWLAQTNRSLPPVAEQANYFWNRRSPDTDPQRGRDGGDWAAGARARGDDEPSSHRSTNFPVEMHTRAGEAVRRRLRPLKTRERSIWTPEEHRRFVEGLRRFGLTRRLGRGGALLMSEHMGTRSVLQVKSHFQTYINDLSRELAPHTLSS